MSGHLAFLYETITKMNRWKIIINVLFGEKKKLLAFSFCIVHTVMNEFYHKYIELCTSKPYSKHITHMHTDHLHDFEVIVFAIV